MLTAFQPEQNGLDSPKVLCDDPKNVKGISQYKDTNFVKDDNPKPVPVSEPSGMGLPGNAAFGSQAWLSVDQQMPMMTPNSGSMYDKTGNGSGHISSFGDVNGDSTESPDGQSNGPTPNSSNGSDGRLPKQMSSGPGQMFGAGTSPQVINSGAHAGFFSAASAPYHMQQQQMGGHGMPYGMSPNWDSVAAQQSANMQNEGVLRALMNMGPMEAMDLSSWDTGNEPMRG